MAAASLRYSASWFPLKNAPAGRHPAPTPLARGGRPPLNHPVSRESRHLAQVVGQDCPAHPGFRPRTTPGPATIQPELPLQKADPALAPCPPPRQAPEPCLSLKHLAGGTPVASVRDAHPARCLASQAPFPGAGWRNPGRWQVPWAASRTAAHAA